MSRGHRFYRKSQQRLPNPVILVICEDSVTEPRYFSGLKSRHKLSNIEIVRGDRAGGDPVARIKYARNRKRETSFLQPYCVFDCDGRPNFDELIDMCRRNPAVTPIASNPCVELWFLLHYEYSTAPRTQQEAKALLQGRLGEDVLNVSNLYERLEVTENNAMTNAILLREYHNSLAQPNTSNPSTTIDELVKVLKRCIKNEAAKDN